MLAAALPCLLLAAALQAPDERSEAERAIAWAEDLVRRGAFEEAAREYRSIARVYPNEPEGELAARRSAKNALLGWNALVEHGPSANRVDVVITGDGYMLKHQDSLAKLAADVPPLFERQQVFREYGSYLNFHVAHVVSADDGIDGYGREADTALGGYTRATDAGHAGVNGVLVWKVLDQIPALDRLAIVFVKQGLLGTGGGGIATIGGRSDRTTLHEFGHAFAGLGDEYAQRTHDRGKPRSGINVSATADPKLVPWAHWLEAKVPGIGVYEGAGGHERGCWKPVASDCLMERGEQLCPVCREAVVLRIHHFVDPIESCEPAPQPISPWDGRLLDGAAKLEFSVRTLLPAKHALEARWYVLSAAEGLRTGDPLGGVTPVGPDAPKTGPATGPLPGSKPPPGAVKEKPRERRFQDRRDRGALVPILDEPRAVDRHGKDGLTTFTLDRKSLEGWKLGPGRYRIVCRIVDTTKLPGERFAWVLQDAHGLLESERGWWVEVR
jgi:IgA Peptidase M64